jgi:epoxyqueuosine reductase
MDPKSRIKKKATELGFDRVGFTDMTEPGESKRYGEWLAQGMQGEMAYLKPDRIRTAEHYPWARTMIVIASTYYQPVRSKRGCGRVARYALARDYHDTLKKRLFDLSYWIEDEFKAQCKTCVDSTPILERPFARKAGLGWIGKNSLLLNKSLGSYFFLGEVMTSLELKPDRPSGKEHCGTCTRCIDLCPTKAIVAPYIVDARRCIAYLTIEYKGVIDRELRPLMGNMIFGCDICQEVCPWNKFAKRADPKGLRKDLAAPELAPLMSLTEEQFKERFGQTPLKRIGRDGFLRNVAIALGNSESPDAIPALLKGLQDVSWLVRLHSAWGLARIDRTRLKGLRDRDPRVQKEIDELA